MFALNIWLAGGRAVRWTSARPHDLDDVEGLVIGGGDDIQPEIYGGALVSTARFDPDRDTMEERLVTGAVARDMPVLGVCRGAQMINIALGGTLHQDAYSVYADSDRKRTVLPRKTLTVEPGTRFAAIAGTDPIRVNALHSQSVDRLGDGLRVAARDRGGMVQAVERAEGRFMVGVQWHPEHLIYARRQRALFRALVAAVGGQAGAKTPA